MSKARGPYRVDPLGYKKKSNEALDKMAENARELGLDYEPVPENFMDALKFDVAKRDAEQPAQQEPVAWPCLMVEADFSENTVTLEMQCTDYIFSAHQHWLSTSPPAQRTWVGLADEEMDDCWNKLFGTGNYNRRNVYRAIEAKLKEKNQ